jgi:hypothetical protein
MKELQINERFESACPPLTNEEFNKLETLILKDGVIFNPILIWNGTIIDGHNRYLIAKEHNIDFTTNEITFESDEKAIIWIKENAISQRNLNDYQRSKLVLELEDYYKAKAKEKEKERKTTKPILAKSKIPPINVRHKLAEKAGVSHGTIDKVKFIDNNAIQKIKEKLEAGEISINKAYNETKKPQKEPDEIDILESAASSLERWISRYNGTACLFEFIPLIGDLVDKIRDKKITYANKN